jgi:hypothetical protein
MFLNRWLCLVSPLDSKLMFEAHIMEVESSSFMVLGIIRKVGKIFESPHVLET